MFSWRAETGSNGAERRGERNEREGGRERKEGVSPHSLVGGRGGGGG